MAKLITIYWRDIPAQVNAQRGRERASVPLSRRFENAVERAAVTSKQKNAHDFVKHWRRTDRPCSDDLQMEAEAEAARVEAEYPDDVLRKLISQGGVADPTAEDASAPTS